MANKIKFYEFKSLVDSGEMPLGVLKDYLEQDPAVSIPKLRFKREALIDQVPEEYNVDDEIYQMLRRLEVKERQKKAEMLDFKENPDVVAEGDSWFRHVPIFFPIAIASRIARNPNIDMENIAKWGDTLAKIVSRKEYMDAIDPNDTEYFMLSAGGNDLQDGISNYIHDFEPQRPIHDYLTEDGKNALATIGDGYRELLSEITASFPNVKVLCYGYDYPRPSNGSKYIGQYLQRKGIPENKMKDVIRPMMDRLNDIIRESTSQFPQATYINCLNSTDQYTWFDDMHPDDDGFRALSEKFENRIILS